MGVVGITVPEEHGGMGLGLVDLVLLLEEAGRAGMPEPLVETAALGVPVLLDAPGAQGDVLRGRWLAAGGRRRGGHRGGDVVDAGRPRRRRSRPAAARARRGAARRARRRRWRSRRGRRSTARGGWRRSTGSRPRRRWWCRASRPRGSSPSSTTGRRWARGRCWWAWPTGWSPWPRSTPRSACSSESRSGPSRP